MHLKQLVVNNLTKYPVFQPVHLGQYIRRLYFWREVAKLPLNRFQKVLDAGCGSGHYTVEFSQRFPKIEVDGINLSWPKPNRPIPSNCRLRQGNLLNLDENQQYDFIWCIDVLEHIPGNEKVLANLIAALRHGGFLYLHVPYDKPGKRIFPENWFPTNEEHIGEQRPLDEWTALLRQGGLQITSAKWTFGFWGELAWEIDRLTDQKPSMKAVFTPILKAMANAALILPSSRKRANVLVVGQKVA